MDLDLAMQKHSDWKIKLRTAIVRQETLDVATISKDNCCDLGKWLYGDARPRFGKLLSYQECVARHTEFHREAGKVAGAINARQYAKAETMITPGSAYGAASLATISAIRKLKKESGL